MSDSVSVSLGFKYNIPGTYSSATAHYSFSTELKEDESPDDAKTRAEALVEAWCDAKYEEIAGK
jgi:hypothetical protein